MKKYLLVLILLLIIPLGQAYFIADDCNCGQIGEITRASGTGSLLSCEYRLEKIDNYYSPSISFETWYHTDRNRIEKSKEYVQKEYERLKEYNYKFEAFDVSDDRAILVYYTPNDQSHEFRKGSLTRQYGDFNLKIYAEEYDATTVDQLELIEECIIKAISKHKIRQEEMNSNKPKLDFSINGRPLRNLVVMVDSSQYMTDQNGELTIAEDTRWLDIKFSYTKNNQEKFFISSKENPTLTVKMKIDEGKIIEMVLDNGEKEKEIKIVNKNIKDFRIDDYIDQIGLYIYNYMYFQDAYEFYENLGVEFVKPVNIILDLDYKKGASYEDYKIAIDNSVSNPNSPNVPYVQYHEFSHYAMHTLYEDVFEKIIKEKNHGGYSNPTTMDSWAEGFAAFMAVQIANDVDHYWARYPSEKAPALYPPSASLDVNYKAWDKEGYAEEYAIAGALWDIVDNRDDSIQEDALVGSDLIFARFFSGADYNDDKVLTKEEFALHSLRDFANSIELDTVDWLGMIQISSKLNKVYSVDANMSIFSKYKGDDDTLSTIELLNLSTIMKYEYKEDIVQSWLSEYDVDKDHMISKSEAIDLLKGYEIIKIISEDYELLELKDLRELSKEKRVQDEFWFAGDKESLTFTEMIDKLKGNLVVNDDDELSMDFDVLWNIIKDKHKDFASVVSALSEIKDNNIKEGIAQILYDHGLYSDKSVGNKVYNKGTEAFIDKNNDFIRQNDEDFIDYPNVWNLDGDDSLDAVTNYQRPGRKSSIEFPGHYVNGANKISYILWEDNKIRDILTIKSDGYIPVPPGADIYVYNNKDTIQFTEKSFTQNYADIKKKGYIAELNENSNFIRNIVIILFVVGMIFFVFKKKGLLKK